MVRRLTIWIVLLGLAGCYEVREDQCELGQVRCEDGKARNCVEVNYWRYWQNDFCSLGTTCTVDTSGEEPRAVCALGTTPDARCPADAVGWVCVGGNEAVRCNAGFAQAQARCPPSSECLVDENGQVCTPATEPASYCEGATIGRPVCVDDKTQGICRADEIPGAETPCYGSDTCREGFCQAPN